MGCELERLKQASPLPPGWSEPEVFADEVELGTDVIRRVGMQSRNPCGVEVTGSAASRDRSPAPRAWFELLERIAVIDAGTPPGSERSRPSRSNGVAIHSTWEAACEAAHRELVERDRVLRSWRGEIVPQAAEVPRWLAAFTSHEWLACIIGSPTAGSEMDVAAVVGFPRDLTAPLTRGFAARVGAAAAIEAASEEALQSLAFLWGEPPPDRPPEVSPTAMFHLDYYLYPPHHRVLRDWLGGGHAPDDTRPKRPADIAVRFEDLTPACYRPGLFVARAHCPDAVELVFGDAVGSMAELPIERRVHPVA